MKTQIPAHKLSSTVTPTGPVQSGKDRAGQARWVGAPFTPANFRSHRLPQIQAKMRVSQPHDPMEREADETAAKIMNMPEPTHGHPGDSGGDESSDRNDNGTSPKPESANAGSRSGQSPSGNSTIITTKAAAPLISEVRRSAEATTIRRESPRGETEEREEKEETRSEDVARKVASGAAETPVDDGTSPDGNDAGDAAGANNDSSGPGDPGVNRSGDGGPPAVDDDVESRIRSLRGRGRPLASPEKRFFESRFGRDFGRVRLHTDGQSADLAKQVNAKAFAVGENIVFGRGLYQPGTRDGRELMAHELTHVVQQGKASAIGGRIGAIAGNGSAAKNAQGAHQERGTTHGRNGAAVSKAPPVVNRRAQNHGETVHRALDEESGGLLDKLKDSADKLAGNIPGFRLVTLILGFNPITRKKVPRTALNLVGAVAALIPGGDVLFQRIQKSGVLVQAFNWLTKEFGKLGITLRLITDLLKTGLQRVKGIGLLGAAFSFVTGDLFPKILRIFKAVFGPTINKLIKFVKKVAIKIKEFVFRGFLRLVGGREGPIFRFLNPITNLLGRIFSDPISFGRNLLGAVDKGFKQFMGNFVKHFKGALFGWMFGTFSKAGLDVPTSFEPAAIFGFVAQLFAVTWTDIRAKVVKRMGPKGNTIMTAVEKSIEVVTILVTKGPQGLYEKIKEDLGGLKETILGAVLAWVRNTIIVKAILKIASLLNPAGAIVQAILAIYNVVMFFIERFEQIKALVQGVMGALQNIVLGKIGPAANKVETTMARGLTLVISFLARLVGLGNIVKPVQRVIRRIKKRIDKAIDKIIRQITVRARRLWRKTKRGVKNAAGKIVQWWRARKALRTSDGENHTIYIAGGPRNPRLMIASKPGRYEVFLRRVFSTKNAQGAANQALRAEALTKGQTIDRLLKSLNRGKPSQDASNKRANDLAKEINDLAALTEKFPVTKEEPPPSQITFGSVKGDGVGISMDATVLSPLVPKGSDAERNSLVYKKLERRPNGNSVYIAGHLLNNLLGGVGKPMNLVPLTGNKAKAVGGNFANDKHERTVEGPLKTHFGVSGKQSLSTLRGKKWNGAVARYRVTVNSRAHEEREIDLEYKKLLRRRNISQDLRTKAQNRKDILAYELTAVPESITATWWEMQYKSGKWAESKKHGPHVIKNKLPTKDWEPGYIGKKFL